MMDGGGKSDSPIVPEKPPNKAAAGAAAEGVEGRGLTKGNSPERNMSRTLSRSDVSSALGRVRRAARRDRKQRFTALLHHVYDVERLRAAYHHPMVSPGPCVPAVPSGAIWRDDPR